MMYVAVFIVGVIVGIVLLAFAAAVAAVWPSKRRVKTRR